MKCRRQWKSLQANSVLFLSRQIHLKGITLAELKPEDHGRKLSLESTVDPAKYALLLRQCGNAKALSEGKHLHSHIRKAGYDQETFIGNLVVQMYGNCGTVEDARLAFDRIRERNVFSWTIMIAAYGRNGQLQHARGMFDEMPQRNVVSWNSMIAACAQNGHLHEARNMFEKMPKWDAMSWNGMVAAYAQKGHLEEARSLFNSMPQRNPGTCNALISGYVQNGDLHEAKAVFDRISQWDVVSWNAMIAAYAQTGHMQEARSLFNNMPEKNVISWNAMIVGYVQIGDLEEAKCLFDRTVQPDVFSWTALISGYAQNGHLEIAKSLFDEMPQKNVVSWTVMVAAYSQKGLMQEARSLFDEMTHRNVVSWNAMIAGYAQKGDVEEARSMFDRMTEKDVVSWTSLITAYVQQDDLHEARRLFDQMCRKDVVAWTTMVEAYAQRGYGREALQLFRLMDLDGMPVNKVTFVTILDACVHLTALTEGRIIHALVAENKLESDVTVATVLVNLYAKCGCLDVARAVFDKIERRDAISWNVMIAGYAQNGHFITGLEAFQEMLVEGEEPDEVTLVCVLSACSHGGLLKNGLHYFVYIEQDYNTQPVLDHYMCMIDLLGRSGQLEKAEDLINNLPFKPDVVAWRTLLCACGTHGDLARGRRAAKQILDCEGADHHPEDNAAPYVLLSNIYARGKEQKPAAMEMGRHLQV